MLQKNYIMIFWCFGRCIKKHRTKQKIFMWKISYSSGGFLDLRMVFMKAKGGVHEGSVVYMYMYQNNTTVY